MKISDIKILYKILACFGLLVAVVAGAVWFATSRMSSIDQAYSKIIEKDAMGALSMVRANRAFTAFRLAAWQIVAETKMEDMKKALTNCLSTEPCCVIKELRTQYRDIQARIETVDQGLFAKVKPYIHLVEKLDEIPGIDVILAMGIIAEASTDTSAFKDERTFAAWAGVAPGNNESAGKKKDQNAGMATQH